MSGIKYVIGDATQPLERPAIIVHVCNDIGAWGAGFVMALSKRWPEPESQYRDWSKITTDDQPGSMVSSINVRRRMGFKLGAVQYVRVEPDLVVANLVGQRGCGADAQGRAPIRYDAVRAGLECIGRDIWFEGREVSVHMPRIGCGLAGGKWHNIELIIQTTLVARGISVTVYDLR